MPNAGDWLNWPLIEVPSLELASDGGPVAIKLREFHEQSEIKIDAYSGVVFGWRGLAELAERFEEKEWLFRGQTEYRSLLPAIGRPGARKTRDGNSIPHSVKEERRTLADFCARSRPYMSSPPADGNSAEWMAIARHHGMATRLLDWSESFLVAAMFACVNSGISNREPRHPEICAIRALPDLSGRDPFMVDEVCVYRPPHITPRIPAQQGVFTVHPLPEVSLDEHPNLERWLICSDACFYLKKKLDLCGINESTLYPDLDGLGRYQSWRYKWGI